MLNFLNFRKMKNIKKQIMAVQCATINALLPTKFRITIIYKLNAKQMITYYNNYKFKNKVIGQ